MQKDPPLAADHAPLRVSVSQRLMSPSVGYVDQVVGEGQDDLVFKAFAGIPRRTDADVVHLHRLSALGGNRVKSGKKRIAVSLAFAAMVRSNRVALVRTWHGADANGTGGRSARIANWILNRVTTEFVTVDPSTTGPRGASTTLVPYGHYRDRFVGYPRSEPVPGRMLCIAPQLHKHVERIVEAFVDDKAPEGSLRVAGFTTEARASRVERLAEKSPDGVSTRLERLSDGAMVMEISAAELVVLPNASELDDLQVIFMALSLDRPVLVPDSPLTRSIGDSVGPGWVHRYETPLGSDGLASACERARSHPPSEGPRLEGRDRDATAAMYADMFRAAAGKTRRR
ncbi:hypothetical protein [Demequina sp. SO4-18]|uniref:hypothetical protein n=1 Tax=Demequina sp. SO4-18 TaxID=3401026 RepID=UPI003B5BFD38